MKLLLCSLLAALALPATAFAHVTVHPNALPSGGFTVVNVQVPNERDKARTTKVDVLLPHGFLFVSYQPVAGWTGKVTYRKLAKPVKVFGETHTQEAAHVIWTSRRGLGPGQFQSFPLSVSVPAAKSGTTLTFKALQTYSNGEVVRWIGSPSADSPAPQVLLRSASAPVQDFPGGVSAARKTSSARFGQAALVGLLALSGVAAVRRRRRVSA